MIRGLLSLAGCVILKFPEEIGAPVESRGNGEVFSDAGIPPVPFGRYKIF